MEVVSVFFSKLGFLVKKMCLVLASFQEEVHWMCSTIHFREETSIHHSKEEATRYRSFLKATELRLSTKWTSFFCTYCLNWWCRLQQSFLWNEPWNDSMLIFHYWICLKIVKVTQSCKVKPVKAVKTFLSIDAIDYIKWNKCKWIFKQKVFILIAGF